MSTTAVIDLTLLLSEVKDTVRQAVAAEVRPSWRERLWTCDPKTRLWLDEVAEALGKTKPAVRALIKRHGLPCRKRQGEYVFLVGELRTWLERREDVINPPVLAIATRRRQRTPNQ